MQTHIRAHRRALDELDQPGKAALFPQHGKGAVAVVAPPVVQQERGGEVQRRRVVLLEQAVDHLAAHVVLVRRKQVAREQAIGALGHAVLGRQVLGLVAGRDVEVGAQGVVDDAMVGAARRDNVVQFCSRSAVLARSTGGHDEAVNMGGPRTVPELLLILEAVGHVECHADLARWTFLSSFPGIHEQRSRSG